MPMGTPWQALKAQCYQESRLDPRAVSPVGARGLCQFMPATWQDMKRYDSSFSDIFDPESSIRACALYMRALHKFWKKSNQKDKYKLSLAAYNAGIGNMKKAQKKAGGDHSYRRIIEFLPEITGRHSLETIGYVKSIVYKWLPRMLQ